MWFIEQFYEGEAAAYKVEIWAILQAKVNAHLDVYSMLIQTLFAT